MPKTPFIGVRISCDMSATNCDLNLDCRSDCCCRREKVDDGCRRRRWRFVGGISFAACGEKCYINGNDNSGSIPGLHDEGKLNMLNEQPVPRRQPAAG